MSNNIWVVNYDNDKWTRQKHDFAYNLDYQEWWDVINKETCITYRAYNKNEANYLCELLNSSNSRREVDDMKIDINRYEAEELVELIELYVAHNKIMVDVADRIRETFGMDKPVIFESKAFKKKGVDI